MIKANIKECGALINRKYRKQNVFNLQMYVVMKNLCKDYIMVFLKYIWLLQIATRPDNLFHLWRYC